MECRRSRYYSSNTRNRNATRPPSRDAPREPTRGTSLQNEIGAAASMDTPLRQQADRERFELSIPFRVCRFSRPVPSATRPPVHDGRRKIATIASRNQRIARDTPVMAHDTPPQHFLSRYARALTFRLRLME